MIGKKFGKWRIERELGRGGNATVWNGVDDDGEEVAIKVLGAKDSSSEQYLRFRVEVELVSGLGEIPGVLPILDYSLPVKPSRKQPAWLSMPVATPLAEALGPNPKLEDVVEAVASVASTLAYLAAHFTVAHRDIKPQNLYVFKGKPVIGDFGLASIPGRMGLTREDSKLGPVYYIAPEMLNAPTESDGEPADVYSLAKTLLVLASGLKYPIPGELRADTPTLTLSSRVDHARAVYLDRLLEKCTKSDPSQRPSVAEMRDELIAWLHPSAKSVNAGDYSDLAEELAILSMPVRHEAEHRSRLRAHANEVSERADSMVRDLLRELQDSGILCARDISEGSASRIDTFGSRKEIAERCELRFNAIVVSAHVDYIGPLFSGMLIETYDDEVTVLTAFHLIVMPGGAQETLWQETAEVISGSAREAHQMGRLMSNLRREQRKVLETYVRRARARSLLAGAK